MSNFRRYMTKRPSHEAVEYKNITIGLRAETLKIFEGYAKELNLNNSAFGRMLLSEVLTQTELLTKLQNSLRTG